MKIRFVLLTAVVSILLASCGAKMRFDQTCMTCVQSQRLSCTGQECPQSFMIGNDCVVTMVETGENIFLNMILNEEKITPREGIPFTIAKFNGSYYLIGDGLKNMWKVTPSGRNQACFKDIKLPQDGIGIPVFEIANGQLKMRGKSNEFAYIYDDENEKWINVNSPKAGE